MTAHSITRLIFFASPPHHYPVWNGMTAGSRETILIFHDSDPFIGQFHLHLHRRRLSNRQTNVMTSKWEDGEDDVISHCSTNYGPEERQYNAQ